MIEELEPIPLNESMKEGLARAYAIEGFRSYLENRIRKANASLIKCLDEDDVKNAQRVANRIKVWEELLLKGRDQYTHFEKLKKNA